jgi:hypothetical protein
MEKEVLKRYSAAEVVLLGIFALGLGLSLVLVKVRGRIELDAPVELPGSGLSAALPKGSEWETAGGWRYESDNAYVLLSQMRSRGRAVMTVRWRYTLCDAAEESEVFLMRQAESAHGQLEPLGILPGGVPMTYGRIYVPSESGEEFLVGVARLGFGRRLELTIGYQNDSLFAETAFRTLAQGVGYERSAFLEAGSERVGRFYKELAERVIASNTQREAGFTIKDAAKRPVGYAMSRFFGYDGNGEGHLRVTERQFESSGVYTESDFWLTGSDAAFTWKTETWLPRVVEPRAVELRVDAGGQLSVQKHGERARTFQRSPMMLPAPLLSEFAAGLRDAEGAVMIDVLTGGGFVVPTRLRRVGPEESSVRSENEVVIVRAEYLHAEGAYEDFVFDPSGRDLGRFEQPSRRPGRLWEAATEAQLREIFGERFKPRGQESVMVF